MKYSKDSLLNTRSLRLERSFKQLESLRRINGGYIAAPNPGKPDGTWAYNVMWLRDIMFATYANEYLGNMEPMLKSYELVMTIMMKHSTELCRAVRKKPDFSNWALHARFHPTTLDEITPDWGHHQLDVLGLFLYKTGDLIKKGHNVIKTSEQRELVKDVIQYLFTMRWETEPDFGMWEEGPEVHSSSVAAVLAGLTMWFDDGHYHYKYLHDIDLTKIVPVSERYFDIGTDALKRMLPKESESRPYDFAQLSLIWPYNIVDEDMAKTIIDQVEKHLLRKYGVIRYIGDHYFNSNQKQKEGNEAEWPLGIAWLAIVHNKMASRISATKKDLKVAIKHLKKAKEYLLKMDELMVEGAIPELYVKGKPNENKPLAWAHSFHIIALQSFLNSLEVIRKKFNIEITEDLEVVS
jgi:phosphorylase kinase alpha/beta subunit